MVGAPEALERLLEGNHRFVEAPSLEDWTLADFHPARLASGQRPFAAVLGCADSRVPVEVVFRQGPGDLFVVRVAGHVPGPGVVGSLEFACTALGTKLILVLGHTGCGAVRAATEASRGSPPESANLRAITDRILEGIGEDFDPAAAVEANVRATMRALTRDSAVLAEAVEQGVEIAGAVYDLASGRVRLL